jgi:acyl-coenzyme A synthetase/AMP-(fatty) acid ligase
MTGHADRPWLKHFTEEQRQEIEYPPSVLHSFLAAARAHPARPREVEDVLYTHPAVREAAVVGVPDAYRGESVKAYVSLRPGTRAEAADIVAYCKERLAAYKYPREVEVLGELPKTATGKILRRELKAPAG